MDKVNRFILFILAVAVTMLLGGAIALSQRPVAATADDPRLYSCQGSVVPREGPFGKELLVFSPNKCWNEAERISCGLEFHYFDKRGLFYLVCHHAPVTTP